jgi:short-subunit dehydrogenase
VAGPDAPLAVITGGSSGIGLAVARLLVGRGYRIVLAARDPERLRTAVAALGSDVRGIACDVTDDASVGALAEEVAALGGRLDLLVGSAGIPGRSGVLDADVATASRVIEVNYLGLVRVTQALWPALERAAGRVVNVVSVAGTVTVPGSAPYAASKHAALAYSRALAAAGRRTGVRVLTVNPGPVSTPGFPQTALQRSFLLRPFVLTDDACARAILTALDAGRTEVTIPRAWRLVSVVAAMAPTTVARISGAIWKPERTGGP